MMKWGSRGPALGAAAAAVAAMLGGCATAPNTSASLAPPKNYRQQVIAKLRQLEDTPSALL